MTADLLRSELLKLRTSRATRILLASMFGLTLLVVSLHALALKAADLDQAANQPHVFGWATTIAALFAALFGAIGITGEFRNGTIRPTLLVTPDRRGVIAAKMATAALAGLVVGLLAAGLVVGIGSAEFAIRTIPVTLTGGDVAQLILGAGVAAALWAMIGVGVGTVVRGQVGAVVGLCVWLLLLENILIGNVPSAARYAPGASAGAIAGMIPDAGNATLLAPFLGAVLLTAYAAASALCGLLAFNQRDID